MFDKAMKLVDAAPHRWISICNVLEEASRNWGTLAANHERCEETTFPLAFHLTAIEELYGLMKPVADLMKETQQTGVPTGLNTFLALVVLRCTVLDVTKPLTITLPPPKTRAGDAGNTASETSVDRPAANLTVAATNTRHLLAAAVDKRFFDGRYHEDVQYDADEPSSTPPPDYLFEMSACMSPFFVKLQWLTVLCSSVAEAQRVGEVIRGKVVDLMVRMAEGADGGQQPREEPQEEPLGGKQDDKGKATVPQKRKLSGSFVGSGISSKKSKEQTQRLLASGIFGESSAAPKFSAPVMMTVREICEQEFERFQVRFGKSTLGEYPVAYLLSFWANERVHFPNMARVAQVLLSLPASSAVVERDFSATGRLVTGSGSDGGSIGPYPEMVLFLNGNLNSIPAEVPALSIDQGKEAIPARLTNPTKRVADLSAGKGGQDDATVDEYGVESGLTVGSEVGEEV